MISKWIKFTAIMSIFLSVIPSQWFNVLGAVIVILAGSAVLLYQDSLDRGKVTQDRSLDVLIESHTKQISDLKERFEIYKIGRK
jgi:hypothetical protein